MRVLSFPFRSALLATMVSASLLVGLGSTAAAPHEPLPPHAQTAPRGSVEDAVAEASRRFGVPERWIRAVMQQESAGDVAAVSRAGAIGLMQVMPATYAELRARHGLGPNPFAIRDNVLAGTAYLREMFDRYGGMGMLAAYNAGPGRWEDHLAGIRPLPSETVGYLARLSPILDLDDTAVAPAAIAPAVLSPFAAPIFVASPGAPRAGKTPNKRADLRQLVVANATVVPSTGELFVRRQPASVTTPLVQPNGPEPATDTTAAPPVRPASRPVDRSSNGLFVPRSSRPEGR